jgi:hypothetical protein
MQVTTVNTPILFKPGPKSASLLAVTNFSETAWPKEIAPTRETSAAQRAGLVAGRATEQRGVPDSPLHD